MARVSVKIAVFWKLIPYSVVELYPEDGKITLVNCRKFLPPYTTPEPRRQYYLYTGMTN